MIKVEKIDAWGFENAIRAMRNPMNSWDRTDSFQCDGEGCYFEECPRYQKMVDYNGCEYDGMYVIGNEDLGLMQKLFRAGAEHRTYARMIQVSMDITAPLYWWKEMDRYTVGKSQVSCSTMHKIQAKEFTKDDFSFEHLSQDGAICASVLLKTLEEYRQLYLETKDKKYWWQMIQLLPASYNQRRTVSMSYETIFKIIRERTGHKLDEWNDFCGVLRRLPYITEIIGGEQE